MSSSDLWSCSGQHAIKIWWSILLDQHFTRSSSTGVSYCLQAIPSLLHVLSCAIQAPKQESFAKMLSPIISLYFPFIFLPPSGCMTTLHRTMSSQSHNTHKTSFHGMNVQFGSIQGDYPFIIDYPKKDDRLNFSQLGNYWNPVGSLCNYQLYRQIKVQLIHLIQ